MIAIVAVSTQASYSRHDEDIPPNIYPPYGDRGLRNIAVRHGAWGCRECGITHCRWCGDALAVGWMIDGKLHTYPTQEMSENGEADPRILTRDHFPAKLNIKLGRAKQPPQHLAAVAACMVCNSRRRSDDSWTPFHERILSAQGVGEAAG